MRSCAGHRPRLHLPLTAAMKTSVLRACVSGAAATAAFTAVRADPPSDALTFPNASGASATYNSNGPIDTGNPFFQSLGSNGRSCASCHQAATGWSVTPQSISKRFAETAGLDPLFRPNDGANSPNADL